MLILSTIVLFCDLVHLILTATSGRAAGTVSILQINKLRFKKVVTFLESRKARIWTQMSQETLGKACFAGSVFETTFSLPSTESSFQFSSVARSCPILCDPVNHSMPGLPVHHQLLESTQTHVHRVGDAIQPSHPLSSPSPSALNLSQHQGLFKWVSEFN